MIAEVLANPQGHEVDPGKLRSEPNAKIDQNIKTLESTTQKFLDAVTSSLDNIPMFHFEISKINFQKYEKIF